MALDRPTPIRSPLAARKAFDALQRSLDGRSVRTEPLRKVGQAGFRRRAASIGDAADRRWLVGQAPVRIEDVNRLELPAGGADRPLEVGRFGVEDTIELSTKRA